MWQILLGSFAVLVALGTWLAARAPRIWVTQVLEGVVRFRVQNVGHGMAREVEVSFDPPVPQSGSRPDRSRFYFHDLPPGQRAFVYLAAPPDQVSNSLKETIVSVAWRGWLGWSSQYQFKMDLSEAENRYLDTVTSHLSQISETLGSFVERVTRRMDDEDSDSQWETLIAMAVEECTKGEQLYVCDYLEELEEAARAKADEIRKRLREA